MWKRAITQELLKNVHSRCATENLPTRCATLISDDSSVTCTQSAQIRVPDLRTKQKVRLEGEKEHDCQVVKWTISHRIKNNSAHWLWRLGFQTLHKTITMSWSSCTLNDVALQCHKDKTRSIEDSAALLKDCSKSPLPLMSTFYTTDTCLQECVTWNTRFGICPGRGKLTCTSNTSPVERNEANHITNCWAISNN